VFENWTRRELDFRIEASTAESLRETAIPGEVIPRIHEELTSVRVLTLEYMDGVSLAVVTGLLQEGRTRELARLLPELDVEHVGRLLATACLHQMFEVGLFHGDPHPGNIMVLRDNRIAFVDFGIFGELSEFQQHVLSSHMESIAVGNIELSFYYYAKQAIPSRDTDERRFAKESKELFRQWYAASVDPFASPDERHLGRFSAGMFEIVRRNHVRLTVDTLLFWRALNALASTAVRLPDYFDLLGEMRRYFEATRPGLAERVAELFKVPGVFERAVQGRSILETAPGTWGRLHDGTLVLNIEAEESPDQNQRDTAAATTMAGAVLGLALLLVASSCSSVWMTVAVDTLAVICLAGPAAALAWR
jgi:ubiquinone biosynthesis protein